MPQRGPQPTSFLTLDPGTAVGDRFGRPVGKVQRVLLHEDGLFDGIIVRTPAGRRFVDAPEVRRISHGTVVLGTTVAEVETPEPDARQRHGVPQARFGGADLTEADRDAVIDALKRGYVRDALSTSELADRVANAHLAETLDELEAALAELDTL